jgi:hypothetical protein
MNIRKISIAAALAAFVALSPAALAKQEKGKGNGKQKAKQAGAQKSRSDKAHDRVVSRDEWRGEAELFDRLDSNRDGYLSEDEIRAGRGDIAYRLREMDTNGDGRISRSEWTGDSARFDQLDRNRDGYLSEDDFGGRARQGEWTDERRYDRREDRGGRFKGLDRNGDGRITRDEWPGNDTSFRNHDRNGDGVISGAELESGNGGRRR